MLPLLTFTGLCVLVYAGEPIKYGYLTIYMHNDLHLTIAVSGAAIGIQPPDRADPHAGPPWSSPDESA
jgi:SET family sugar efflux transporter-like MFS transporter